MNGSSRARRLMGWAAVSLFATAACGAATTQGNAKSTQQNTLSRHLQPSTGTRSISKLPPTNASIVSSNAIQRGGSTVPRTGAKALGGSQGKTVSGRQLGTVERKAKIGAAIEADMAARRAREAKAALDSGLGAGTGDEWQPPTRRTPNRAPGSARQRSGLAAGPHGKASTDPDDDAEMIFDDDGSTHTVRRHSDGSTTVEHEPSRPGNQGSTVVYDSERRHVATAYDDGSTEDADPSLDIVDGDPGRGLSRAQMDVLKEMADEDKARAIEQHRQRTSGSSPSTQPNENNPQDVGWRGVAPPVQALKPKNEKKGPLVSPPATELGGVIIDNASNRKTIGQIKDSVTQPGVDGSSATVNTGGTGVTPGVSRFAQPPRNPDGPSTPPPGVGGGTPPIPSTPSQ